MTQEYQLLQLVIQGGAVALSVIILFVFREILRKQIEVFQKSQDMFFATVKELTNRIEKLDITLAKFGEQWSNIAGVISTNTRVYGQILEQEKDIKTAVSRFNELTKKCEKRVKE